MSVYSVAEMTTHIFIVFFVQHFDIHFRCKLFESGIFLPFQNRDPGPMILGKIIRISVKLGKWIQNRTGDIMHIWC